MDHASDVHHDPNGFMLPIYALYIIGFAMMFMLIAIICLAVALYLVMKNKQKFEINTRNKQYDRQESTGIATLYNSYYDEQNKNDESTLTVNSGIIEINRVCEPVTPTRIEDSKITFTRRPIGPGVPIMHRGQMDEICKEVLRKVQKSDSASFRDLNALLNGRNEDKYETKYKAVIESENDKKNESNTPLNIETKHEPKLVPEHEPKLVPENEPKYKPKHESKHETEYERKHKTTHEPKYEQKHETKTETKNELSNDVKIEVKAVEDDTSLEVSGSETEYDTVPSPVRFRHSGTGSDVLNVDSIPVYDLLPRRSYERKSRNVIQMDNDTQYLLPLSTSQTDSCYINAKRLSYNP